jgi:hypothetical protein
MNTSKLLILLSLLQGKTHSTPNLSGRLFAGSLSFCATGRTRLGFGTMGHGQGETLATLYLEDISDFIVECVDDNFVSAVMRNVWVDQPILLTNCTRLCNKNNLY